MKTEYRLKYWIPGALFSDYGEVGMEDKTDLSNLPRNAYSYVVLERSTTVVEGEVMKGKFKKVGPTVYCGEEFTGHEAIEKFGSNRTLVENIRCNHYDRLVQTIHGQIFPIGEDDIVVSVIRR